MNANGLENCIVCRDKNVHIEEETWGKYDEFERQFIHCLYCDLEFGFSNNSIYDVIEIWNELPRKEIK